MAEIRNAKGEVVYAEGSGADPEAAKKTEELGGAKGLGAQVTAARKPMPMPRKGEDYTTPEYRTRKDRWQADPQHFIDDPEPGKVANAAANSMARK